MPGNSSLVVNFARSRLESARHLGLDLPLRRRWRILRRVGLPGYLGVEASIGLCCVGLELPSGETKRGMSGVSLIKSRAINVQVADDDSLIEENQPSLDEVREAVLRQS